MGCIALSELCMLLLITFWPVREKDPPQLRNIEYSENEVILDEAFVTTHASSPPPPPRPQMPEPVPNDEVIEEEIPDFDFDISDEGPITREGEGRSGNSDGVTADPEVRPRVVHIVEPSMPAEAKKAGIRAQVTVNFLVNTEGRVEEATISEIRLYDKNGDDYEVVDRIGYGLTEATLQAALRWRFKPARQNDEAVRSFTEQIFTYGF